MKIKLFPIFTLLISCLVSIAQCPVETYKTTYSTSPEDPNIPILPRSVFVDSNNKLYEFFAAPNFGIQFIIKTNGSTKDTINVNLDYYNAKVKVDNSGSIYINGADAIYKYIPATQNWNIVAGGNGYGSNSNQLSNVQDFAIDINGNIYVADLNNHRVQKWSVGSTTGITVAGGNGFGSQSNQTSAPNAIAINSTGEIFVAVNGGVVQKWVEGQTSGTIVAGGNGNGSELNQFDYMTSIIISPSGDLIITDPNNRRVVKWVQGENTGTLVYGNIGFGNSLNHINHPNSVALDYSGNMYIASNEKMLEVPSNYAVPSGILVNSGNSTVNFGDTLNLEVQLTGQSPWSFKINDQVFSNISSSLFTHKILTPKNTIYKLTNLKDNCGDAVSSGQLDVTVNNSLCFPEVSIITTSNTISNDSILFKDFSIYNNTEIFGIDEVDISGGYAHQIVKKNLNDINGPAVLVIDEFTLNNNGGSNPSQIFVDKHKNIYLGYLDNHIIQKWAPPYTSSLTVVNNYYGKNFIVDSIGTIYSSFGIFAGNQILKWVNNPDNPIIVLVGTGTGPNSILKEPAGLKFDKDNNLIFADIWDGSIKKLLVGSNIPITIKSGLKYPSDFYFNVNGELFVIESCHPYGSNFSNKINKFDKNGLFLSTIAENLNCPSKIQGDSLGNLYFKNNSNSYYYMPNSKAIISGDSMILQGDSAKITVQFSGVAPYSLKMDTLTFEGITQNPLSFYVLPDSSKTFVFSSLSSICGKGEIISKDKIQISVIPCDAIAPMVSNDSISSGGVINIIASGCNNGLIKWYDSVNSISALFTGSSFQTPVLNSTTSYFVSCVTNTCESVKRNVAKISVFNCPKTHEFNSLNPSLNQYNAFRSITSSVGTISNTNFKAGNAIFLSPGFYTNSGVVFKAEIGGCQN